jgi:glycosyltransferase involved in cell wall biosynthesis
MGILHTLASLSLLDENCPMHILHDLTTKGRDLFQDRLAGLSTETRCKTTSWDTCDVSRDDKDMDKPLIIVHTEASVSLGGQGLRILTEALWMRDRGHRLVIIAPGHSRLLEEARRVGLEPYPILFSKRTQGGDFYKLVRCLRRIGPDILNTHSSIDTWVGCLAGRLCGVSAIIRTRHIGAPVRSHLANRWLYGALCDHVFTTANNISSSLITGLGLAAHKVSTISTGVQPPAALPTRDEARLAFSREFDLPPDTRFIGCLAVLRQGKGHAILLDAFRQIRAQIPRYHLLIIGGGAYQHTLDAFIAAWGLQQRVHLTGHRPDPWLALRALDVNVLASTSQEGMPQALLQAQFAGCPVVGSNCGGIAEVITHEKTGLLVPRGEAGPLGEALLRLLTDQDYATRLACNARQHVQVHHTMDVMGHKILAVYRELLPKH